MKPGQIIDAFFTYLVGLTIVVLAMVMGYFGGSGSGVIAGFVALVAAYIVNMLGATGLTTKTKHSVATFLVFLCWTASVVSVVAAILCVV